MIDYYNDVYLKRMNRDGNNIQERVRTAKEREFDKLFIKKTKYRAIIYGINDEESDIPCSIQPSKWTQDKIVSNILVPLKFSRQKTGDLFRTFQKNKDVEYDKIWLVVYVSDDITHGYQSYEAIELDTVITIPNQYGETLYTIPAKIVSETSVFVRDQLMSYGAVTYREPLAHRKFFTQNFDFLTKDTYFEYEGRGWKISGNDDLSIKNVAILSFEESLVSPPEPNSSRDILVGEDDNFFLNHENKR